MSGSGATFDVAVVGGGLGGLATAALAQRRGLRTVLMEAHTKLGGCAGWFARGPYTFDAGATALMGLGPGEPLAALIEEVGLEFRAERTGAYRVHLPDRSLDVVPDADAFERNLARTFDAAPAPALAHAHRRFWRLQAAVGKALYEAGARGPRLPARSPGDLLHDLRVLGPGGVAAAATSLLTVRDVLVLLGLAEDRPFVALVAMLLQDTAQAGPEAVPFANAAACLHAYRAGMSRPRGGMRTLVEGLGERLRALGGDLRTATLVERVEPDGRSPGGPFAIRTRRRGAGPIRARQVVFDLPIDLAARLLGRGLDGRLGRLEAKSRAQWSAFTGYLAIGREAIPEDSPFFHQVLRDYASSVHDGNNVLISLSPPGDSGYGPADVRVATLSTHVRPGDWRGLGPDRHAALKAELAGRLRDALGRALPDAPGAIRHAEFATPRSFARYTRRTDGAVGGAPVRRGNANLLAVGSDALGRGLWLVGDSVFPGQGTLAVTLAAFRLVERLTGASGLESPTIATDWHRSCNSCLPKSEKSS
jgi:C-3',4' desaturase CrtD